MEIDLGLTNQLETKDLQKWNKTKITKNITNTVFTKVLKFLGLKLASMQALFHSWQPLIDLFGQVMHFGKFS